MASNDTPKMPPEKGTHLGYVKPMPAGREVGIHDVETIAVGMPFHGRGEEGDTKPLRQLTPPSAAPKTVPEGATLVRGTVLPRVKIVGDKTHLINESRDRYQEENALGAGGFGEVVAALDQDIDRKVAIKRLLPDMQFPEVITRFVDEIRTVGRLEHPNIVPIHDVGVDEQGRYFFVMKHLEGETLEAIIEGLAAGNSAYTDRFTFERRVQIFQGILEAVHYAHSRGIIHRDIKPANVMVGRYGEVVVMDWGIAKHLGTPEPAHTDPVAGPGDPSRREDSPRPVTMDGTLLGTPPYMSPEQARGDNEAIDARSDIYSLCVLFYELLTLRHPLADRKGLDEILDGVTNLKPANPTSLSSPHQRPVPAELGWFVLKGLEKDREARYQSVEEMIVRLGRRADGYIPVQCPLTLTKAATNGWVRFVDHHPQLYMAGMATLVLGGLGLGVFQLLRVFEII